MRLRTSLLLLSLAAALPITGFALVAAGFVVQQENQNLVRAAKERNRASIGAVEAEVRGAINTLRALTVAPSLASGDLPAFHRVAIDVLATQPAWRNLLVHDPSGRQLINARLPWGAALLPTPVAPQSIAAAVQKLEPAIDDLAAAPRLQNELGIPVRFPLVRNGEAKYVLTAVLNPSTFQRLLVDQRLPPTWVSGIVDRQGRLIARVPEVPTGTMASRTYLEKVGQADEGWYRGPTIEGRDTYTAFYRSPLTGWTIGYAIPAEVVLAGATRAAWLMGLGILLSVAAAALIGLWLGRRITRPMAELVDAASALPAGTRPAPPGSTIDEVARLADALSDAAQSIQTRDHELRKRAEELQRANTNKSHFLALLAHELRNPLAPLRNGLALLRRQRDQQRLADTQAMMERQVDHMARLIEDLLDVSRIDRGLLELRRERIAVDNVVATAIETVKPLIEARKQALVVRYARAALHVDGDPVRLSQVLSNLLNNAAKFTPALGSIEVRIEVQGAEVVITVQDNGVGFTAEEAGRIFELFVQLDSGHTKTFGGLGIGLTLVRSLVEMHGGRVAAFSEGPGKGARFTVRLPVAAAAEPAPPAPVPELPFARRRILVVDDNSDAAHTLAEVMRIEGYEVSEALDGRQGLDIARVLHPDVAFVDLSMPDMSGLELARALRAEPWAQGLRLVAVTGLGRQSDIEATREAGFEAHLVKPVAVEDALRFAAAPRENVIPLRSGPAARTSS